MIKNVLSEIGGVGVYGVISISLFFLVFTAALVRVCLMNKAFINKIGALPLDEGTPVRPQPVSTPATKGASRHE